MYSIPFTEVFGKVACQVCPKPLVCGGAERNWGAFKHLKNGKRAHMSAEKAERQETVYGTACMDKARSVQAAEESSGNMVESHWTDADMAIEMGFETWSSFTGNVPVLAPKLLFCAWIETWEWDAIQDRDALSMAKLLHKYQGLHWRDDNDELQVAQEEDMEWQGG
jgi:hypothetical protein